LSYRIFIINNKEIGAILASHSSETIRAVKAIETMHLSEKRYRTFFERSSDAIFMINAHSGIILNANKATENLVGYTVETIVNNSIKKIIPDYTTDLLKQAWKLKQSIDIGEIVFRGADDIEKTAIMTAFTLEDEEIIVVIAQEITQRKIAQKSLERSEKEYRSTLDNLSIGIVVYDSNRNIILSNPAVQKILELSEDEIMQSNIDGSALKYFNEDSTQLQIEDSPVNIVLKSKKHLSNVIVGITSKNHASIIWVNVNAIPIFYQNGEIEKIIVNFIDITDQKNAEAEKKKLESQLRKSQKLETMGTLAGGIAHDFNNILSPIIGYSELAMFKLKKDDSLYLYIELILQGANRAKDLVEQFFFA